MGSIQLMLLSLVLISASFAGACFLGWRLFEHPRHALIWTAAFAVVAVQYSVNLARDLLPGESSYWILANCSSFLAVICAVWGHRERLGLPTSGNALLRTFCTMAAACFTVVLVYPNPAIRTALAPGFAFVCMSYIAIVLVTRGPAPRLAQNVAAVVHLLFGLTQCAATTLALGLGSNPTDAMMSAYHLANFALMPSLFVAMGLSVIFLMATDMSYRLRLLALTDPLTQVSNRRGFINNSLGLLTRARRHSKPLSLILCDLDHFKRVNDEFGHVVGDRALQHFVQIVLDSVRTEDAVGRIGGEEFAICLEGMDSSQALQTADRIRDMLKQRKLISGHCEVKMTASFGICSWRDGDDISAMLQRADGAMYSAKDAGRDAVSIAEHPVVVALSSNRSSLCNTA